MRELRANSGDLRQVARDNLREGVTCFVFLTISSLLEEPLPREVSKGLAASITAFADDTVATITGEG